MESRVYFGEFSDKEDVADQFECDIPADAEILFATYDYTSYEADAMVLFRQGGNLYEAHGSHCSCMGLEGQWSPEETSPVALLHRLEHGKEFDGCWMTKDACDQIAALIRELNGG